MLQGSCFFFKIILKNLLSVLCVTVKFKQSLKKAIFSSYKVLPFPIFFTIPQFSVIQVCARYFFLFFSLFVCVLHCLILVPPSNNLFQWLCSNSHGESWDSSCKKSVLVQNYWVPVQKTTSPKLNFFLHLCNHADN